MERLRRATRNSWNGLLAAARNEAAFREELAILVVSIPLAFVLGETLLVTILLVGVVVGVMVVELLNSAIEKLADRVTMEHDPLIGRVKDMGSAAVGLSLVIAALIWLWAIARWFGLV